MELQSTPLNYLPIIIQMLVALGFVVTTMFVTHKIGPKRKTKDKLTPFESGIEVVGNARTPYRTNIDHIARKIVINSFADIGGDLRMIAPVQDTV